MPPRRRKVHIGESDLLLLIWLLLRFGKSDVEIGSITGLCHSTVNAKIRKYDLLPKFDLRPNPVRKKLVKHPTDKPADDHKARHENRQGLAHAAPLV